MTSDGWKSFAPRSQKNHASTSSRKCLQARCSFWCPTDSVKALKTLRLSSRKQSGHHHILNVMLLHYHVNYLAPLVYTQWPIAKFFCTVLRISFKSTFNIIHFQLKCKVDWLRVKVSCPTWHKIGHREDVLPNQYLSRVLKKLNLMQQKHICTNKL